MGACMSSKEAQTTREVDKFMRRHYDAEERKKRLSRKGATPSTSRHASVMKRRSSASQGRPSAHHDQFDSPLRRRGSSRRGSKTHSEAVALQPVVYQYMVLTPFFVRLTDSELLKFSKVFTVKTFPQSTILTRQGEESPAFFVIAEGEVHLEHVHPTDPSQSFVLDKCPGDFFGIDCLAGGLSRFTVTAVSDALVLMARREKLDRFFENQQDERPDMQSVLVDVVTQSMDRWLERIPFLKAIHKDAGKLSLLGSMLHYVTVEDGHRVFEEGSLGNSLYIVVVGKLQAVVHMEDADRVIKTFEPGDYFGETGLVLGVPRTASIAAETRSLLLELRKDDFLRFLEQVPTVRPEFESVTKRRTAESFRRYNVPFFSAIPDDKYSILADLCNVIEYPQAAVIFQEGDEGDKFYIVAHGELRVTMMKNGVKTHLCDLTAGQYFGEIALIRDAPRQASVVTTTRCVLLSISRSNFTRFFEECPEAVVDFQVKLARYDVDLKTIVYHPTGIEYLTKYLKTEYSEENIEFWKASRHYRQLCDRASEAYLAELRDSAQAQGADAAAAASVQALDADRVQLFMELPGTQKYVLKAAAEQIVNRYITEDAPNQVNLNDEIRSEVVEQWERGELTPDLFSDAQHEIIRVIEKDSFRRFKASPLFQEFLSSAESYDAGKASAEFKKQIKGTKASSKFDLKTDDYQNTRATRQSAQKSRVKRSRNRLRTKRASAESTGDGDMSPRSPSASQSASVGVAGGFARAAALTSPSAASSAPGSKRGSLLL